MKEKRDREEKIVKERKEIMRDIWRKKGIVLFIFFVSNYYAQTRRTQCFFCSKMWNKLGLIAC
jgi:hypothetical protein